LHLGTADRLGVCVQRICRLRHEAKNPSPRGDRQRGRSLCGGIQGSRGAATTSRGRGRSECSSTVDSRTSGYRRLKTPARRSAEGASVHRAQPSPNSRSLPHLIRRRRASSWAPSGDGRALTQISEQPYGRDTESVKRVADPERNNPNQQIEHVAHGAAPPRSARQPFCFNVLANATIEGPNLIHWTHL
jgi:hypothetical protein